MNYRVIWETDVDAGSPDEAARQAREIQRDRFNSATVYDVHADEGDVTTRVDLALIEPEPIPVEKLEDQVHITWDGCAKWHAKRDKWVTTYFADDGEVLAINKQLVPDRAPKRNAILVAGGVPLMVLATIEALHQLTGEFVQALRAEPDEVWVPKPKKSGRRSRRSRPEDGGVQPWL